MRHCREGTAHESPLPRAIVAVHTALPRGAAHESPPCLARHGRSCKSHESRTHCPCFISAKVQPMTHRLVRNNVLGWWPTPPCHANPYNSDSCCVPTRLPLYHHQLTAPHKMLGIWTPSRGYTRAARTSGTKPLDPIPLHPPASGEPWAPTNHILHCKPQATV